MRALETAGIAVGRFLLERLGIVIPLSFSLFFSQSMAFAANHLNSEARTALVFALSTEQLVGYYQRGEWPQPARVLDAAKVWLARHEWRIDERLIRELAEASDDFARRLAAALPRETGLQAVHEMHQSLDDSYVSPLANDLKTACADFLRASDLHSPDPA